MDLTAHRTLYTGDCSYLFMAPELYNPGGGPYTAGVLHDHIGLLAARGVDTYLANPNTWLAWFPSKTTPAILDGYTRGDREFFENDVQFLKNEQLEQELQRLVGFFDRCLDLAETGIDWIAEIAKACRRHGVSPWLTVRMNDMHGSEIPEGSCLNRPLAQAGLRLSGKLAWPPGAISPYYAGLNYAHQEVRDYMFRLIEEVVENYDFEGLELDWLRNPLCLEVPVSVDDLALMTDWIGRIRALTQKRAVVTGKPFPLGIRMLPDCGQMRAVGLDVEGWAASNLIDFVSPSNFFQCSWDIRYDELRSRLGNEVAVFGVTEGIANWLKVRSPQLNQERARPLPASVELLRGNAAGKLAMGVAGIETFNFFTADEEAVREEPTLSVGYGALSEVRNIELLRNKEKGYLLATQLGTVRLLSCETCEQLPVWLESQCRCAFRVAMCAETDAANLEFVIQIVVECRAVLPPLGVSFNGTRPNYDAQASNELLFAVGSYSQHTVEHQALNFVVSISEIRDGLNEIVVYNDSTERASRAERIDNAVCIVSVELAVRSLQVLAD